MALWGLTDALASVPTWETLTESFVSANVTDGATGYITIADHSFETGDKVIYQSGTGNAGTGFSNGNTFFVKRVAGQVDRVELYTDAALSTQKALPDNFGDTGTLQTIPQDIYYVDATEAVIHSNIEKGLGSPGWWKFTTKDAAETFTSGGNLAGMNTTGNGTTGIVTITAADVKIGDRIKVSGTRTGTGKHDNSYSDPTTYSIGAITAGTAPNVTKVQLTSTAGAAITSTANTFGGLTFELLRDTGVRYQAEHLCAVKTTGTNETGVDGSDDSVVEG